MTEKQATIIRCTYCDYGTLKKSYVNEHIKNVHVNKNELNCVQGDFLSKIKGDSKKHKIKRQKGKNNLKFYGCDYSLSPILVTKKHVRSGYYENKIYKSSYYEYSTSSEKRVKSPEKLLRDQQNQTKCNDINYTTKRSGHKNAIPSVIYNQKKKHPCNHCEGIFTRKFYLGLHIFAKHDLIGFAYSLCSYPGTQKRNFQLHTKEVYATIKDIKCWVCDYICSGRNQLTSHIRKVHSNAKDFKCTQCNYVCYKLYDLKAHVKRVHSHQLKGSQVRTFWLCILFKSTALLSFQTVLFKIQRFE